jgi:hypothetical protein
MRNCKGSPKVLAGTPPVSPMLTGFLIRGAQFRPIVRAWASYCAGGSVGLRKRE